MCNGRSCCDRFLVSGPYKLSPTHSVGAGIISGPRPWEFRCGACFSHALGAPV